MRIYLRTKPLYSKLPYGQPYQLKVLDVQPSDEVRVLLQEVNDNYKFYYANSQIDINKTFQYYEVPEGTIIETTSNPLAVALIYQNFENVKEYQEMKRRSGDPHYKSQPLINLSSLIKEIFNSDVPYIGDEFEKLKTYFPRVDLHGMKYQYKLYQEFDSIWSLDPVGHYIMRTNSLLTNEEMEIITNVIQKKIPIEDYHEYIAKRISELQKPKQQSTFIGIGDDEDDIPATQVVHDIDNDVHMMSSQFSISSALSSGNPKKRSSPNKYPSFEIFFNGRVLKSTNEALYKKLRGLEEENLKLIKMFPSGGLAMMPRVSFVDVDSLDDYENDDRLKPLELEDLDQPISASPPSSRHSSSSNIGIPLNFSQTSTQSLPIPITPSKPIVKLLPLKSPPRMNTSPNLQTLSNSQTSPKYNSLNSSISSTGSAGSQRNFSQTVTLSHFPGSGNLKDVGDKPPQPDLNYEPLRFTGVPTKNAAKSPNKNKIYCPNYMSAPYACLIALSLNIGKKMSSLELAVLAQPFTSFEIVNTENTYGGKNDYLKKYPESIKTLSEKQLMNLSNTIYSSSTKGIQYGRELHQFHEQKLNFDRINSINLNYRQKSVMVVIDDREQKKEIIIKHLTEWGVPFLVRHLNAGDYCFIDYRDDYSDTMEEALMFPYLIERKTWLDLQSSINDKRYEKQKTRMVSLDVLQRRGLFYLIEGSKEAYKDNDLHLLEKKIEDMAQREEFHIITTLSLIDTSRHLASIAKMLSEEWDEAQPKLRFADINRAAVEMNPWSNKSIPKQTNVKRSYVSMKLAHFKDYILDSKYRNEVNFAVRQTRDVDKLFILGDTLNFKKNLTTMANKMLKDYINYKFCQTPQILHWTLNNLLLINHIESTLIDYFILHLHFIVGVKVMAYPNEKTIENTKNLRDHDINLEVSFDRNVYKYEKHYATPIVLEELDLPLPTPVSSSSSSQLSLTNSASSQSLSSQTSPSSQKINPSPTKNMMDKRHSQIYPIELDDD